MRRKVWQRSGRARSNHWYLVRHQYCESWPTLPAVRLVLAPMRVQWPSAGGVLTRWVEREQEKSEQLLGGPLGWSRGLPALRVMDQSPFAVAGSLGTTLASASTLPRLGRVLQQSRLRLEQAEADHLRLTFVEYQPGDNEGAIAV